MYEIRISLTDSYLDTLLLSNVAWKTGSEYLDDYNGLLVTGLEDAENESAAIPITAKLTAQRAPTTKR